jgi:hypothetical protein
LLFFSALAYKKNHIFLNWSTQNLDFLPNGACPAENDCMLAKPARAIIFFRPPIWNGIGWVLRKFYPEKRRRRGAGLTFNMIKFIKIKFTKNQMN